MAPGGVPETVKGGIADGGAPAASRVPAVALEEASHRREQCETGRSPQRFPLLISVLLAVAQNNVGSLHYALLLQRSLGGIFPFYINLVYHP